jgi:hypothetical protein
VGSDEDRTYSKFVETMEHEDAAAEAIGPNFETRAERGRGIWADCPRFVGNGRGYCAVMIAVIQNDFEWPSVVTRNRRVGLKRPRVSVSDALQITLCEPVRGSRPSAFKGQRYVHTVNVLGGVFIRDSVPLGVVLRFREPGEGTAGIRRICYAARVSWVEAEDRDDILDIPRSPVHTSGSFVDPLLHADMAALTSCSKIADPKASSIFYPRPPVALLDSKVGNQLSAAVENETILSVILW